MNFQISKAYLNGHLKLVKNEKKKELIYKHGKTRGISNIYYEKTSRSKRENYKNGEFIDGKCFDERN
jgi:protein TonB